MFTDAGSLKRGVKILKILAGSGSRGLGLTQIADRSGFPHSSVHRVLRQLLEDRLVSRNENLKRYRLGPLAFELGIACSTMYDDLRDLCSGAMEMLSAKTGDTSYLVVRSGFDAVCMHRHEGEFPVRALVLAVGGRRPLGVGAGGLALLAAVDQEERFQIIERIAPSLERFGKMTTDALERACDGAKLNGTAIIHETLALGISGIGRAFTDDLDQPVGALSVAGLSHRMNKEKTARIGELLKEACADVQRRLRRPHLNGWMTGS